MLSIVFMFLLTICYSLQVPLWSGTVTLLDEALLPALSLMECNCAVAEEIWGLMKYFPYEIRLLICFTLLENNELLDQKFLAYFVNSSETTLRLTLNNSYLYLSNYLRLIY